MCIVYINKTLQNSDWRNHTQAWVRMDELLLCLNLGIFKLLPNKVSPRKSGSGCLEPRLRGGAGRDGFMRFYSCCTGIFKLKVKTAKLLKLLLNTTFRKGDLLWKAIAVDIHLRWIVRSFVFHIGFQCVSCFWRHERSRFRIRFFRISIVDFDSSSYLSSWLHFKSVFIRTSQDEMGRYRIRCHWLFKHNKRKLRRSHRTSRRRIMGIFIRLHVKKRLWYL